MREELKTERLLLRPPRLTDAGALAKKLNDRDILRMTGTLPFPYFSLCADYWIYKSRAERRHGTAYHYIIEQKEELVGSCGLFPGKKDWELGYWMAKNHWQKGFTSEAVQALLKEAFDTPGCNRITASVFDDNPASINLLMRLGFTRTQKNDTLYSLARGSTAPGHDYALASHQFAQRSREI